MKSKGFTVIEIIIAIFLFSLLLSVILSAAAFCMKTLNTIDDDVELQQQAQFIFNFIEDKIIESAGVVYLQDNKGFEKHNTSDKVCLGKIIFKNSPGRKDKGYIFRLTRDPEYAYFNLKYGIGLFGGASDEVGNYIASMEVEPIPADKIYTESEGILFRINFILDGHSLVCENSYHYRNSSGGVS